jgi:hypothetical protein
MSFTNLAIKTIKKKSQCNKKTDFLPPDGVKELQVFDIVAMLSRKLKELET